MTTVINFNILNFFRLKLNNYTVNDVRIKYNSHDRKKDGPQGNESTIDVTPYHRTYDGIGELKVRDIPVPCKKIPHMQLAMDPTAIDNTYDRRGNAIQIYQSKGMHIDSYA